MYVNVMCVHVMCLCCGVSVCCGVCCDVFVLCMCVLGVCVCVLGVYIHMYAELLLCV